MAAVQRNAVWSLLFEKQSKVKAPGIKFDEVGVLLFWEITCHRFISFLLITFSPAPLFFWRYLERKGGQGSIVNFIIMMIICCFALESLGTTSPSFTNPILLSHLLLQTRVSAAAYGNTG